MTLVTPEQYAKDNGVHKATVYRWIDKGRIPVVWQTKKVPLLEQTAKKLPRVKPE